MNFISVNNEYSKLKKVFLGIAPYMFFPPANTAVLSEDIPSLTHRLISVVTGKFFSGKKVPSWIVNKYKRELSVLHGVLRKYDIEIVYPEPILPQKGEELGLTQVFARDPIIVIGNTIIRSKQRIKTLRKERRGYDAFLEKMSDLGVRVLRVPEDSDIYLEGGDVVVDLPYVFVGVGDIGSNIKGVQWLKEQLDSSIKVIPVPIIKRGVYHLDMCMTIIGRNKGIICRSALKSPLPSPLDKYDFIEVDEKVRVQAGTNVLVVSPNTIVLQKRHVKLKEELEKKGYNAIGVDFNWHASAGGGFRCATHPLYREN